MNKIYWPWFKYLDFLHSIFLKKYVNKFKHGDEYSRDMNWFTFWYIVPLVITAGVFVVSSFYFYPPISSAIFLVFSMFHAGAIHKYMDNSR
jgi:hypothetical protein